MGISLTNILWDYLSAEGKTWLEKTDISQLDAKLVKQSINRSVFYLSEGLYVKIFQYQGIRSVNKVITGGKAIKEGNIALELLKRGVDAPQVMGFGHSVQFGRIVNDVLITREVPDAMRLVEYNQNVFPELRFDKKRESIYQFARFIRHLHNTGVYHRDLNFGNILVRKTGETYEFVLVDLDKVRLAKGPLPKRLRFENLGVLLQMFWSSTTLAHRFRFLKQYGLDFHNKDLRSVVTAITLSTLKKYRKRGNTMDRHCISTHAKFIKKKSSGLTSFRYRNKDLTPALQRMAINPGDFFRRFKAKNLERNIQRAMVDLDGEYFELLRFEHVGLANRLVNTINKSKGIRTWMVSFGFIIRKIFVPHPLICMEEKKGGLITRSYILSIYPKDFRPIANAWHIMDEKKRTEGIAKLAIILGRMHQLGCVHGNLSWENIAINLSDKKNGILLTNLTNSYINSGLKPGDAINDLKPFINDMKQHAVSTKHGFMFFRIWRKHTDFRQINDSVFSRLFF